DVEADNIAEIDASVAGQAMDDLIVHRNARITWIFAISQKRASGAIKLHSSRGELVDLAGGHAGLNKIGHVGKDPLGNTARRSHRLQITGIFEQNHCSALQQMTRSARGCGPSSGTRRSDA